jgi:hypothetical protein
LFPEPRNGTEHSSKHFLGDIFRIFPVLKKAEGSIIDLIGILQHQFPVSFPLSRLQSPDKGLF